MDILLKINDVFILQWLRPKLNNNHPKNVSSTAGAAGTKPKVMVSIFRNVYKVDFNDERIIDYRTLWYSSMI
jgi:hypothetical protein